MTRTRATILAALLLSLAASSQPEKSVVDRRGYVTLTPLFQGWSLRDNVSFHETTVALSAYTPIGRYAGVSLRSSYAYAGGEITTLDGFSDAQLSLNYHFERAHVVLSCGVNFPSGRRELSADEFATSMLLSQQLFTMAVPNYGQGWAISPGVSWAAKLSDKLVLGLGGAYYYKGSYKPFAGLGEYEPAEEILITAGLDFRLNELSTISTDVLYTRYGADRFEDAEVYDPGNKWVVSARSRTYFGSKELTITARYRSRAKSDVAIAEKVINERESVVPDEFEIFAQYTTHLGSRVLLRSLVRGAFFQNSSALLSGANLYTLGILPEIELSSTIRMPIQLKITGGTQKDGQTLGCIEVGVGVSAGF